MFSVAINANGSNTFSTLHYNLSSFIDFIAMVHSYENAESVPLARLKWELSDSTKSKQNTDVF